MSSNSDGNLTAKLNGDWGEQISSKIIESKFGKFTFIDDIVDYKTESGIYIEIKTCQSQIKSSIPDYPLRIGRFNLNKAQHTFLTVHDGYYVFLVKNDDLLMQCKIIPAKKIKFKQLIIWKHIFKENTDSGRNSALSIPVDTDTASLPDTAQNAIMRDFVYETSENRGD